MLTKRHIKKICIYATIFCLLIYESLADNQEKPARADDKTSEKLAKSQINPEDVYKRLFTQRRAQHYEAVNAILGLGGYEKQYKMVALVLEKLFKTMTDSKVKLMEAGFTPGDPFPTEESIKDAFSNVAENTVFFGDLLLRLPEITEDILKRNKEWDLIIKWSVGFCNESNIFEKREITLLHLMAQELGIVEKDENYVNPYKHDAKMSKIVEEVVGEELKKTLGNKKPNTKKKEKLKRGPRLSAHTEL